MYRMVRCGAALRDPSSGSSSDSCSCRSESALSAAGTASVAAPSIRARSRATEICRLETRIQVDGRGGRVGAGHRHVCPVAEVLQVGEDAAQWARRPRPPTDSTSTLTRWAASAGSSTVSEAVGPPAGRGRRHRGRSGRSRGSPRAMTSGTEPPSALLPAPTGAAPGPVQPAGNAMAARRNHRARGAPDGAGGGLRAHQGRCPVVTPDTVAPGAPQGDDSVTCA